MKKPSLIMVGLMILGLTACSSSEQPTEQTQKPASVAEAQAVPMSAQPADSKTVPPVVGSVTENTATATATTTEKTVQESTTANNNIPADATETPEEEADNSEMENITEDAQVVDDEPASPDAPKAPAEDNGKTKETGNAKVGN